MKILVINPGSTSTKLAVFEDSTEVSSKKLDHSVDELKGFETIFDQYPYRLEMVKTYLREEGLKPSDFDAVVGRGGLVRPIPCGTYLVNDRMIEDLKAGVEGIHASNLGPALAQGVAKQGTEERRALAEAAGGDPKKDGAGVDPIPAFIVDPITVDELIPEARITGRPDIMRESRLHTLNQKAVAREVAKSLGKKYEEMNFVVVHLGTGTSIAAHRKGLVIDMCDARGEGPMSCDRCGGVNTYLALVKAQEAAKAAEGGAQAGQNGAAAQSPASSDFIKKMYTQGGLYAHLGTKDLREIEERIDNGDEHAELVLNAMIYQCAKEIGAQAAAMSGEVDRIIITGGIAYDEKRMKQLEKMVRFIAPVVIMPGEEEMKALALGAVRVLTGEEEAKRYFES